MGRAKQGSFSHSSYPAFLWPVLSICVASRAMTVALSVQHVCPYGREPVRSVRLRGVFPFCLSHKQDPPFPSPSAFPPEVQLLHTPVHSWTLSPSMQEDREGL